MQTLGRSGVRHSKIHCRASTIAAPDHRRVASLRSEIGSAVEIYG